MLEKSHSYKDSSDSGELRSMASKSHFQSRQTILYQKLLFHTFCFPNQTQSPFAEFPPVKNHENKSMKFLAAFCAKERESVAVAVEASVAMRQRQSRSPSR